MKERTCHLKYFPILDSRPHFNRNPLIFWCCCSSPRGSHIDESSSSSLNLIIEIISWRTRFFNQEEKLIHTNSNTSVFAFNPAFYARILLKGPGIFNADFVTSQMDFNSTSSGSNFDLCRAFKRLILDQQFALFFDAQVIFSFFGQWVFLQDRQKIVLYAW